MAYIYIYIFIVISTQEKNNIKGASMQEITPKKNDQSHIKIKNSMSKI